MIVWCLLGLCCSGADMRELAVLPPINKPVSALPSARPEGMVADALRARVQAALRARAEHFESLKTPMRITQRQQEVRKFFLEQLGEFPALTPSNARVVGHLQGDRYRAEKILFASRPHHHVTGVLFLPLTKPPFPGVIVPCGHSPDGKAAEAYQRISILLAMNGIAAFCYDPIGQGERYQIPQPSGKPLATTLEHTYIGVGCILLGTNTAHYRVWDGMRALDYLASRPDIDARRLGCTGNSGGGTLTSYLMALDDRIVCAVPSCYLTSMSRLLDTIGPQDAEQNIFGQVAFGMDHADYILARAPRPTLMCAATKDYFDISGTWDSFRQAKRVYTKLGYSERVELVEADETHGFSRPLRIAAVRWLRRWLLQQADSTSAEPITEPDFAVHKPLELHCTPQGQVTSLPNERTVFDFNRDQAVLLGEKRQLTWSKTTLAEKLMNVRKLTGIRPLAEIPPLQRRKVGRIERTGYLIEKLLLEPEPGIVLPALAFIPAKPTGTACLYLHGQGKQVDAGIGGPLEQLVQKGILVLAVDLRGLGETEPPLKTATWDGLVGRDWQTYFLAYLLGQSMVGARAEDILGCARFLRTYRNPSQPYRVEVVAIGKTAVAALHAAALEPELFAKVILRQMVQSWTNVVETPRSKEQLINTVHGALQVYDLPDLVRLLGERVRVEEPRDAAGVPL